jgi:hypothetical protein
VLFCFWCIVSENKNQQYPYPYLSTWWVDNFVINIPIVKSYHTMTSLECHYHLSISTSLVVVLCHCERVTEISSLQASTFSLSLSLPPHTLCLGRSLSLVAASSILSVLGALSLVATTRRRRRRDRPRLLVAISGSLPTTRTHHPIFFRSCCATHKP